MELVSDCDINRRDTYAILSHIVSSTGSLQNVVLSQF